jgi:hypothetical protein
LPIVRLLAAIRALPETVSNLIAARSELIRGSLIGDKKYVVSGMVFDVVHSELVGLADTAPLKRFVRALDC